jgi:hypothetical protein
MATAPAAWWGYCKGNDVPAIVAIGRLTLAGTLVILLLIYLRGTGMDA